MARSKKYRRTRNSLGLGLCLLLLWFLDLGGTSPKDGQRDQDRAPTGNEAAKGSAGDQQAKPADPEQVKSTDDPIGREDIGPLEKPPEDYLVGLEATFDRFLLDEAYEMARGLVERALAARSESVRLLGRNCQGRLRSVAEEKETLLRSRIQAISLEQAETETARFAKDFPKRMEGLLVELPAEVRRPPTSAEMKAWSLKINERLPAEIRGVGRLLRLAKEKAILRVSGQAGGFRHARVDLVSLPPASLLALCPDSEESAARRILSSLYAEAGLPVSASWLFFGKVSVQSRAPDPGR